jgi:pimeloyl-ACP methyl ester carboxylesterase
MLKEQTFDTGTVTINCAEGPPSGSSLVLIHGGGDRWQGFLPILPALTMRWHVFAVDLRGHGKSGRVPGQYRPEHYVADVAAFLERRFAGPVSLFGHSLGGWIALLVAARLAERVGALILGDPPLDLDRFLAYEGSEARIGMWCEMRGLIGSGMPVPELASLLVEMPGMDSASSRAWLGR